MTAEAVPVFVVVGNVNQGKSSIVAALAEDSTVPIAAHPGTTVRSGEYVFKSGDRPLFRLVDTPGFQDARFALAWMQERSESAADHRDAVKSFVAKFEGQARFEDEVRLLKPILEGAAVLYVVDASSRFQPSHEAEMEILRWTGQSGMALINRTRDRDFSEEWRPILEQFFNVVRTFNAHRAGFPDRMNLLRSFRELREDWRASMDRAIEIMEREWRSRRDRCARVVGDFLIQSLSHVELIRLAEGADKSTLRESLDSRYRSSLKGREENCRAEVEAIYQHRRVSRDPSALMLYEEDLFSDASFRAFGLRPAQLARYGAAWGAAVGGGIDLMVGGLSFFLGAGIGALAGGAAGYFGGTHVAKTWNSKSAITRWLTPGDSGEFLCMGPVKSPRFAWVLADRAFVHYKFVRDRSHARQDVLQLPEADDQARGIASALPAGLRDALDRVFRAVIKEALNDRASPKTGSRMYQVLALIFEEI